MKGSLRTRGLVVAALAGCCFSAAAWAADAAATAATAGKALIPNPSTATHNLDQADLQAFFDGLIPYGLESGDIAGGVVAVVKDGQVIFTKGYGYSDVEAHAPVDPEKTMFRPGSVSKLFTWTAVMQMVEQGKLDLDRDVNQYLDFHIPDRSDGPITLRNIMTHTPGFEEQIKSLITSDPKALIPLANYVRNSTPTRIYKAGSTPAYSNYATALAGYLVQKVSGQSFDDYIDNNIFKPLGMTHASFRQPLPAAFVPDMAKGYQVASGPSKPYEIVVPAPAGSLAASGADMAKFMIAHLQDGEYLGQRILQAQTAEQMHTTATNMIPPLNRMMLGFYEQNYNGHRIVSHGGDTEWMHSYLHLLLDDHVGLYMSFNSLGHEGAAGHLRQAVFNNFMDRYFPGPWPGGEMPREVQAEHARLLTGFYEDSRRPDQSFMKMVELASPVKVVVNPDGSISISLLRGANGVPFHYREFAPFTWREVNSGWRLAAKMDNGKVARISMDQVSPFMVFEPIPAWRSPGWILPGLGLALGACLLTSLFWPVAAISRRRHRVSLPLTGLALRGHKVSRIAAVAISVVSLSWLVLLLSSSSALDLFSPSLDPVLILLYTLSVIGYIGGAAGMLWATKVAFSTPRPIVARVWTVVLALSSLVLLYIAWLYHLMSFVTKY